MQKHFVTKIKLNLTLFFYFSGHWEILLGHTILTKSYKLKHFDVNSMNISCFSDTDFASDMNTGISTGRLILFIEKALVLLGLFQ